VTGKQQKQQKNNNKTTTKQQQNNNKTTTKQQQFYFFYEVGTGVDDPGSVKTQATVIYFCLFIITSNSVFLNRRPEARYRAMAAIIPGREGFS